MSSTPNLDLPYILPSQAQKHVTHNEAIRTLDALVQLAVLDRDRTAPPASSANGDRHIVAAGASGAWSGRDGNVAAFQDGAWAFFLPRAGWVAVDVGAGQQVVHDGTGWIAASASGDVAADTVGVNATADPANRLSVSAPATLLSHEGAGHQLKINKASAADTASLLFQSAWSGRAEMGLAGDDDFRVKVSADGTAWHDAILVDRATGAVSLPNSAAGAASWGAIGGAISAQADLVAALSEQQSLAAHRPGPGRWTRACAYGATTVTLVGAANRIDLYPWRAPFAVTVDQAGVNVTGASAGAEGRIVVYACDADGNPEVVLAESDLIDLSATGARTANLTVTLARGQQVWIGIRHSGGPTLSAFQAHTTPDLDMASIATAPNKILRRIHGFGTPAPSPWIYDSGETSTALATAVYLRAG